MEKLHRRPGALRNFGSNPSRVGPIAVAGHAGCDRTAICIAPLRKVQGNSAPSRLGSANRTFCVSLRRRPSREASNTAKALSPSLLISQIASFSFIPPYCKVYCGIWSLLLVCGRLRGALRDFSPEVQQRFLSRHPGVGICEAAGALSLCFLVFIACRSPIDFSVLKCVVSCLGPCLFARGCKVTWPAIVVT